MIQHKMSNNSSNVTKYSYVNTTAETIVFNSHNPLVICLTVVMVGAFFGNALVILAFFKGPRKIRTYTNYFVVNLAVSDFMVGCLSLPLWIVINLDVPKIHVIKDILVPMDMLFGVASIYSLVAISLERLFAVRYPTRHLNLQRKSVILAIACIWGLGIILFIIVSVITYVNEKLNIHEAWVTPMVCITFVLPLVVITTSYIVLFTTASQLMKADNQILSLAREIRIAKTVSVIIGLFCVCWAPFLLLNLLYAYNVVRDGAKGFMIAVHVTKALHYTNSMMNVFVYAVRSPDFNESFRKIIRGGADLLRERACTVLSLKDRENSNSRTQLSSMNGSSTSCTHLGSSTSCTRLGSFRSSNSCTQLGSSFRSSTLTTQLGSWNGRSPLASVTTNNSHEQDDNLPYRASELTESYRLSELLLTDVGSMDDDGDAKF